MNCRICSSSSTKKLINFGKQPIVHNLLNNLDEKYPSYEMILKICNDCNFVYLNHELIEEEVYENYFTMSSWKDQSHSDKIFNNLRAFIEPSYDENILEVGCNDGSFLKNIELNGFKNIYGIEPAKDAYKIASKLPFKINNGFLNTKNTFVNTNQNKFDVIISRHVLEHIKNLRDFFDSLNIILKQNGILIIEVPDFQTNLDFTDYALWEEHVNYFTIETLHILFGLNGFRIFYYDTAMYTGRAVTVYAMKSNKISFDKSKSEYMSKLKYGENFYEFKQNFNKFINKYSKTAIYGCGAKSSFLANVLELKNIENFIDDQKEKLNYFVPGIEKQIKPWDNSFNNYLKLLGVNFENEAKVINKRNLKKENTFSILPPSKNIPKFWIEKYFKGKKI